MSELTNMIRSTYGIANEHADIMANFFVEQSIDADHFYVREGEVCRKLSFVVSGHLRLFNYTESGKEITQWITSPGEFITELSGLAFDQPSRWNIQCLTPCTMHTISQHDYRRLAEHLPDWERIEKLFLSKCFITLENRVFSFLSMTAEERYQHLLLYKGHLVNEIPLQYLASMLSMTPETLSRIRKKITS